MNIIVLTMYVLTMISDVQINNYDSYPDSVATLISEQIGNRTIYDAGDLVENGYPAELTEYERYAELFPNSIPVPGNHDHYDGLIGWVWPTFVDIYDNGIHIIGFDTGQGNDQAYILMLQNALYDNGPTVVYMHHQMYSGNDRNGNVAEYMRSLYENMFIEANVDLVISGHGHAYERHHANGITYMVIGGAGAHLDTVSNTETLIYSASIHHWIELEYFGDSLEIAAKDINGIVFDRETILFPISTGIEAKTLSQVKELFE